MKSGEVPLDGAKGANLARSQSTRQGRVLRDPRVSRAWVRHSTGRVNSHITRPGILSVIYDGSRY